MSETKPSTSPLEFDLESVDWSSEQWVQYPPHIPKRLASSSSGLIQTIDQDEPVYTMNGGGQISRNVSTSTKGYAYSDANISICKPPKRPSKAAIVNVNLSGSKDSKADVYSGFNNSSAPWNGILVDIVLCVINFRRFFDLVKCKNLDKRSLSSPSL